MKYTFAYTNILRVRQLRDICQDIVFYLHTITQYCVIVSGKILRRIIARVSAAVLSETPGRLIAQDFFPKT
jgi:hypothetical protein